MTTSLHDDGNAITFRRSYYADGVKLFLWIILIFALLECLTPQSMILKAFEYDWEFLPMRVKYLGEILGVLRQHGVHYVAMGVALLPVILLLGTSQSLCYDRKEGRLTRRSLVCLMGGATSFERKDIARIVFVRQIVTPHAYSSTFARPGREGAHVEGRSSEQGVIKVEMAEGGYREVFEAREHVDVAHAAKQIAEAMELEYEVLAHETQTWS